MQNGFRLFNRALIINNYLGEKLYEREVKHH